LHLAIGLVTCCAASALAAKAGTAAESAADQADGATDISLVLIILVILLAVILYRARKHKCPNCGSRSTMKVGDVTAVGVNWQEYRCRKCNHQSGRKAYFRHGWFWLHGRGGGADRGRDSGDGL